uniref:Uncharacterized protein n=1 Tax=viral metagenome TaxID=1070528 RepID=A0A6M3IJ22_9ZZZZ
MGIKFPSISFGTCERCGMDGRDQTVGLTGADAAARSTTGNGVELKSYDGKKLCDACINELKADKQSLQDAKKHAEKDKFLGKAGFVNTIS